MKSFLRRAVLTFMLLLIASPAFADGAIKSLLKDVFYGGLSGGLVGGAVAVFSKHPGSHLDFVGFGAAGGALVGAAYGTMVAVNSLAEVENGHIRFFLPTIKPQIQDTNSKGKTPIVFSAELIRGKF